MKTFTAKLAIAISLVGAVVAGTAYAQQPALGQRDRTVTRAEAQTKAAELFARMDANKDGTLDAADRSARRNMVFDRLDTDKNGTISREEFSARPQRAEGEAGRPDRWSGRMHHGGHGRHYGDGFGRLAGSDGPVTQAEFTARALQRFDQADANKDGRVTKEERQAARASMRAQWQNRTGAKPAPTN